MLYFVDIPSVHAIWFATFLSIACSVFIIPCCATTCSLYSAADVAHHLSVFLSIVMVRMCCPACPVILCSVASVDRIASPPLIFGFGIFSHKCTPSNLWWNVHISAGSKQNTVLVGCFLHNSSGNVIIIGVGSGWLFIYLHLDGFHAIPKA